MFQLFRLLVIFALGAFLIGHLGPELQELAEKKTQQINWAYQQLRH
jgi:hypothetical protein